MESSLGRPILSTGPVTTSAGRASLSIADAKKAHFWSLAFPALRLFILAFMFTFFGVIQSARAYTVIGSVFGAFIFSVAGVSFWVGCHGMIDAYSSVSEKFPDKRLNQIEQAGDDSDCILAVVTDARIIEDRFVEYRIDISTSGRTWFVWRRYSDFYRVFKQESHYATTISSTMLPSKRWFGSHLSATFIEERKAQLNAFLQALLKEHGSRRIDEPMANFFGM